ncbi:hypothetical protein NDU88_006744 [Pleurodeles waltl]|uniref:Uncharacterized protein n=1 Tax=Pleurodeles waltl TaxID=8319 RepID=A0AAV7MES6_PLEWA|nr:hypothetical protein NDU88_006744 [Pleurodeles waltl]
MEAPPGSGISRGSLGEAKPGEIAAGERGDARRGSACGPRGETQTRAGRVEAGWRRRGAVAPRWRTGGARPEDGERATPPTPETQMSGSGPWGKDHTQPRQGRGEQGEGIPFYMRGGATGGSLV